MVAYGPGRADQLLHPLRVGARPLELRAADRKEASLLREAPGVDPDRIGSLDLLQLLVGGVPTSERAQRFGGAQAQECAGRPVEPVGARDLCAREQDRQRLLVAGQRLQRAALVDRGACDIAPRFRFERELPRPVELGESLFYAPGARERRAERVTSVPLDDCLPDLLRDGDRLLAHGDRFGAASREHQLLAECGKDLRACRGRLVRDETYRLAAVLENLGPRAREVPEVAPGTLVQQSGGDRIRGRVNLRNRGEDVVECTVGAAGHLGLRRCVPHHLDVTHPRALLGIGNLGPQREDQLRVLERLAVGVDVFRSPSGVEGCGEGAGCITRRIPVARELGEKLRRTAVEPVRMPGEHFCDARMQRDAITG